MRSGAWQRAAPVRSREAARGFAELKAGRGAGAPPRLTRQDDALAASRSLHLRKEIWVGLDLCRV